MTTQEIINLIYSGVQAITTVVLVVITYKQMKQGQKSLESVDRSMKADFLPIIILGFSAYNSTEKILNISLTNCGKGLARKPRVIFPGQADIVINSLNVGEVGRVTVDYNTEYILTKTNEKDRKIVIEYHDVFDRKIITEANLIEYKKLGPGADQAGIGWETWTPIIP